MKAKQAECVNHVLYCTDFSEPGNRAFRLAVQTAVLWNARLTLLHVIPEPEAQFWKAYIYEVDGVDDKARADVDAKIDTYRQLVPQNTLFAVEHTIGREDEEILNFASREGVDYIVLGRPDHSVFQDVFFGSTWEKVVRNSRCPVLTVPTGN